MFLFEKEERPDFYRWKLDGNGYEPSEDSCSSSFPAVHPVLPLSLYSTSVFCFWTEPSDCKPFLVSLCSVLFLCSSDTFLWMAVHHSCCWILWSQKHVCSLRPLSVRKPSVLCAFFLSVSPFKDIQKKELWRLSSCATCICRGKGVSCLELSSSCKPVKTSWHTEFYVMTLRSTKRKWRLQSALALLLTH